MTIPKFDVAKIYRLPKFASQETLECRFDCVVKFGDKVLVSASQCLAGMVSYAGAVYEFTTDDQTCEGEVMLIAVSDDDFEDDGHALQWCMQQ